MDFENVPDTSKMSLEEMHAHGVYPVIEEPKRLYTACYQEKTRDFRLYSAYAEVKWDKYDFDIKVKIPMIMSEQKILEIFQDILDNVISERRAETNGGLVY